MTGLQQPILGTPQPIPAGAGLSPPPKQVKTIPSQSGPPLARGRPDAQAPDAKWVPVSVGGRKLAPGHINKRTGIQNNELCSTKEIIMNNSSLSLVTLLAMLALLVAAPASAQHYAGVVGGINLAKLAPEEESDQISSKLFPGVGAVLGIKLAEDTYLHVQPMYLQKGAKLEAADPQPGSLEATLTTSYLEIPIFLKREFGSSTTRPYLLAGPTVGIMLKSVADFTLTDQEEEVDLDDVTESYDVGIALGGGVSIPVQNNSVFFEGRYVLGLTDVLKEGTVEVDGVQQTLVGNASSRGLQFKAGFTIPFGADS